MTNLIKETIQAEVASLQAQLDLIEERAAALRAMIAQYQEALSAEQLTATEALATAKNAQETALSALVAAKAAQEQLANINIPEAPIETPFCASPEEVIEEEDDEVEIELVYADEEEDDEVEIELVYSEEETEEETEEKTEEETEVAEDSIAVVEEEVVEVEKPATTATLLPPIEDIRKAISLGDRFLFQRELFAGNGELMNKTIDKLNSLSSLEEAQAYIGKHFQWDTESQAYELFMNILKRRW